MFVCYELKRNTFRPRSSIGYEGAGWTAVLNSRQGRINPNTIHGTSSGPVFEHSDPRLLHGDAYLQPISTPISTPHSGGQPGGVHVISSSVSVSNHSLYSGLVGRGIDDNGMDSPTYIQLESSSGAVLPPGGSYSPAGNAIYSTTPNFYWQKRR